MNELRKYYIKDLEFENNLLLTIFLISFLVFTISMEISIKNFNDLKTENTKLEQQVIDYKWQLEQVKYIITCKGSE